MTKLYAVYGASGCGRSLMPVAHQQLARQQEAAEIVFIDDALTEITIVNGHRAMNYQQFKAEPVPFKAVLIAIANSQVREKIALKLEQDDISLWSVQADNTVLMDQAELATGYALSPFVTGRNRHKRAQRITCGKLSLIHQHRIICLYRPQ